MKNLFVFLSLLLLLSTAQAKDKNKATMFSGFAGRTKLETTFEKLHQGMKFERVRDLIGIEPSLLMGVDGEPDEGIFVWIDGKDKLQTKFRLGRLINFEGKFRGMKLGVH